MLERMYQRWAEAKGFRVRLLDRLRGADTAPAQCMHVTCCREHQHVACQLIAPHDGTEATRVATLQHCDSTLSFSSASGAYLRTGPTTANMRPIPDFFAAILTTSPLAS